MALGTEGRAQKPDAAAQADPEATRTQSPRRARPRLPEREVLRRLWRIYEMALAAAHRHGDQ
jgi:hypothetical protein